MGQIKQNFTDIKPKVVTKPKKYSAALLDIHNNTYVEGFLFLGLWCNGRVMTIRGRVHTSNPPSVFFFIIRNKGTNVHFYVHESLSMGDEVSPFSLNV